MDSLLVRVEAKIAKSTALLPHKQAILYAWDQEDGYLAWLEHADEDDILAHLRLLPVAIVSPEGEDPCAAYLQGG